MQEHTYRPRFRRILGQSFLIWLFILLQLSMNIYWANTFVVKGSYWPLMIINGILALINIPSLVLFAKYYSHSKGKEFVVTYGKLGYRNIKTGILVEMKSTEIVKIKLVQNVQTSRLPWLFHEYFMFIDKNGKEIVVTSYIMDISEFWLDTLGRRVSASKLQKEERCYPIF